MKTDNLQNGEHHVLICVKSKHGCESGMMSWTYVVFKISSILQLMTLLLGVKPLYLLRLSPI
jgi:hypothetical protein